MFTSELWGEENQEIDGLLATHVEQYYTEYGDKFTTLSHVSSMNTSSPKDQFLMFSSIFNYHKSGYPSLCDPSKIIQPTHIDFIEHGLYDPLASENLEGKYICTFIP